MAEITLQDIERWQHGDGMAFWWVYIELWDTHILDAVTFLSHLIEPDLDWLDRMAKAQDLAEGAFWAALEELDLKISSGKILTEEMNGTETERTFRGKVSGREGLGARDPFAWENEGKFRGLFYTILIARCWDALRHENHHYTETIYAYNVQRDVIQETKKTHRWRHIRLQPTRDPHAETQGSIYEDELVGPALAGETLFFARDTLYELTEGLAQVEAQLRPQGDEALAETLTEGTRPQGVGRARRTF